MFAFGMKSVVLPVLFALAALGMGNTAVIAAEPNGSSGQLSSSRTNTKDARAVEMRRNLVRLKGDNYAHRIGGMVRLHSLASNGYRPAQRLLFDLLREGKHVEQDWLKAYYWGFVALENGEPIEKELGEVGLKLTNDEELIVRNHLSNYYEPMPLVSVPEDKR